MVRCTLRYRLLINKKTAFERHVRMNIRMRSSATVFRLSFGKGGSYEPRLEHEQCDIFDSWNNIVEKIDNYSTKKVVNVKY